MTHIDSDILISKLQSIIHDTPHSGEWWDGREKGLKIAIGVIKKMEVKEKTHES